MSDELFPEKVKELQKKITENLVDSFFNDIKSSCSTWKKEELMALVSSVLIVFSREIITHTIVSFDLMHNRKEFLKAILGHIKDEVNDRVKRHIQ